jgi:hypothetical protein
MFAGMTICLTLKAASNEPTFSEAARPAGWMLLLLLIGLYSCLRCARQVSCRTLYYHTLSSLLDFM